MTGLAKIGALFLFLIGLFWTAVGGLAVAGGGMVATFLAQADIADVEEGQLAQILGGVLVGFGLVILVLAVVEIVVGIAAWRGSGFARMLGVLYAIVFGGFLLLSFQGARNAPADADTAGATIFALVMALAYAYTAVVFIFRYRSSS